MSFFGFDTSGHNTAAPGFSQAHDPFAGLSQRNDDDDALEFEETYDGLGDQLDETDDAFNDDTFGGGGGIGNAPVGKDFDFFGQTAKVADAIEEEHLRFNRNHQPPRSVAGYNAAPTQPGPSSYYGAYNNQAAPKPARSGYEKYKPEPTAELQVDASIWGTAPKKQAPAMPSTAAAPPPAAVPAPVSRKMMSLEEVEAAMRAQSQPKASPQPTQAQHPPPVSHQQQPQSQLQQSGQDYGDYRSSPVDNVQAYGHPSNVQRTLSGGPHGHPVQILQRPSSKHTPGAPSPLSQQHQPPMVAPTQILQNPKRLSGDGPRAGVPTQPKHRSQNSYSRQQQVITHPSQLSHLSEDDKATYLEAEARRAKRNHKIYLQSKDNGLMTPQDKSFITRIQLQQLVSATGDPNEHGTDAALVEDFYYQVHNSLRAGQRQDPNQPLNNFAQTYLFQTGSRHGGMRRHGRGHENHMHRMEQQVQRAVEAAKNKPKNKQLVIEGSLGKISFSNAKTPKPLLNIKRTESSGDARPGSSQKTPASDGTTDKKAVLRSIEDVYITLMKMEDHDRDIPPPLFDNAPEELIQRHVEWQDQAQQLNSKLWTGLKVHEPIGATEVHPFIAFMSYPKGKKAIPRVFRHISHEQRTTILTMLIVHLDQLDVVRGAQIQTGEPNTLTSAQRESIELFSVAVMPSLFANLNESDLNIVAGVLGIINGLNIDNIARTRIGVSMLTMILSRAEIIKESVGVNEQAWQNWVSGFNRFFNLLEPTLPYIFPGTVASGEDIYVWQFLAAIGIGASPDEQQRLVLAVKDRVMDTVALSKTLPADMAKQRLDNVNLFMKSIGLDVELLI